MNIVFIGMSGSGKTAFASYFSKFMNMPLIDTDEDIYNEFGEIAAILKAHGKDYFHSLEDAEFERVLGVDNHVVALGCDCVFNRAKIKEMKRNAMLVYLKCSPQLIHKNLDGCGGKYYQCKGDENLLSCIQREFDERDDLYNSFADIALDVDRIFSERAVEEQSPETKFGALFIELTAKLEYKIYKRR